MITRYLASTCVLLILCLTGYAANSPNMQDAEIVLADSAYLVSFTLPDLINAECEARIRSGLSVRFLYQIKLYAQGERIASTTFLRQVLFLLWDGEYLVESSETTAQQRHAGYDDVLVALSRFQQFRLINRSGVLAEGPYEIKVSVVIDPVFQQEKEKMSEWLCGPHTRNQWGPRGLISVFFQWFMVREEELAGEHRYYSGIPTLLSDHSE